MAVNSKGSNLGLDLAVECHAGGVAEVAGVSRANTRLTSTDDQQMKSLLTQRLTCCCTACKALRPGP